MNQMNHLSKLTKINLNKKTRDFNKYKSDEATLVFGISVNKPVPDVEPTRSQLIDFKKIDLTTLVRTFEGS